MNNTITASEAIGDLFKAVDLVDDNEIDNVLDKLESKIKNESNKKVLSGLDLFKQLLLTKKFLNNGKSGN